MIVTNPNTEVIYFKVYEDYFTYPRNKTTPHNITSSYCKKIADNIGIFFVEYDFYICDDFTKEPFFVYRTKNSFTFVAENEEKDLKDLSFQKARIREEILGFIKNKSLGYSFENLDGMFYQHYSLELITAHGFYV